MRVVKAVWALVAAAAMLITAQAAGAAAPPANNNFEASAPLADAPSSATGSIDEATVQTGEPGRQPKSVWYRFQPSRSGRVVIELRTADDMQPELSVYTGSSLATLQLVANGGINHPRAAFKAVAGETYHLAVGGMNAWQGTTFTLRTRRLALPPNDAFAHAMPLRIPGEYTGNIADATAELGEHESHRRSLWYRFTPGRTGKLTIDMITSPPDFCQGETMRLYTGSRLRSLRLRATTRRGYYQPLRTTVRRGLLYHLAVNCRRAGFGDFVLTLSDGSIKGKGVKLAVTPNQTVQTVRARGLAITVTTKRRVRVSVDLRISRRTARRLGLTSRELARATGVVDYHKSLPAVLQLASKTRRALNGVEHLKATIRLEILRSHAPNRVLRVPVRLQGGRPAAG